MTNQTKSSGKKDTRSRKIRDLSARPLGARKGASVKGGGRANFDVFTVTKNIDTSTT
jgi:hypothetical protein